MINSNIRIQVYSQKIIKFVNIFQFLNQTINNKLIKDKFSILQFLYKKTYKSILNHSN